MSTLAALQDHAHERLIAEICDLDWKKLTESEMISVAWGYYYFSIQFRENLEIACDFYPEDADLIELKAGECDTDNLSPFPGVSAPGERMDHDEFMRRLLALAPIPTEQRETFAALGERYLQEIRDIDPMARALSISSYEDGGLSAVFTAMLTAPEYDNPALNAFRFFLSEHIRFDSDPDGGHGSLARRLVPDATIVPLWTAFKQLFVDFTPSLKQASLCDLVRE